MAQQRRGQLKGGLGKRENMEEKNAGKYNIKKPFSKAKVSQLVVQESAQIRRRMQGRAHPQQECFRVGLDGLPFAVLPARPPRQKHRMALLWSPPCQHDQLFGAFTSPL